MGEEEKKATCNVKNRVTGKDRVFSGLRAVRKSMKEVEEGEDVYVGDLTKQKNAMGYVGGGKGKTTVAPNYDRTTGEARD